MAQPFWIDDDALAARPTSGPAWDALLGDANRSTEDAIDLSDQNDPGSTYCFANALVARRTTDAARRADVRDVVLASIGTESGGRTLAAGREAGVIFLAADLAELRDARLAEFGHEILRASLDGRTIISTHEDRPNNWGTHAGFTRVAIDLYLIRYGTRAQRSAAREDLARAIRVWRGWLGDRDQYAGFDYGDLDWQADPGKPVGINPAGATKDGHSIDGVLPDDQRRAGNFTWPPTKENYVYEALQGAVATLHLLARIPHPQLGAKVWEWSDGAIIRAFTWLHDECKFPATGDDTWMPHLVNHWCGSSFPAPVPSSPGKHVGYADYTHGSAA